MATVTKYNLRRYNRRRHELLVRLPEPMGLKAEQIKDEQQSITDAMRIRTHWLTGNISTSLFWEDMICLFIRFQQLYSFLFITYYEFWPSRYREEMTWWFMLWGGHWYIWTQDMYYAYIEQASDVLKVTFCYLAASIIIFMGAFFLIVNKTFKFRLENVYTRICWYKWLFWLIEWLYFPLLFNTVWNANCKFHTEREAIIIADCDKDIPGNHMTNVFFICMAISFAMAALYNVILIYTI